MSTTYNALTVGIQHVYKYGLLPSNLSIDALKKSAANEAAKLVKGRPALTQSTSYVGGASDTASLSSKAANALTQVVNSQPGFVNTASDQSVPKSAPTPIIEDTSGSQINVLA